MELLVTVVPTSPTPAMTLRWWGQGLLIEQQERGPSSSSDRLLEEEDEGQEQEQVEEEEGGLAGAAGQRHTGHHLQEPLAVTVQLHHPCAAWGTPSRGASPALQPGSPAGVSPEGVWHLCPPSPCSG